ncbi:UDP-glucose/GDP-mannose dehydrogenase family protein, partial [bacterium]|nr:UDP-glucose/GDP-mannose dehydrogenase family protein [bacterium]
MKVCVIGAGYVGLVSGACLAGMGNKVICVDNDKEKIILLKKGKIPIYEPGLKELVKKTMKKKLLYFTTDIKDGVTNSEIIFIAVNTPPRKNGEADLCYVEAVSREVAQQMKSYKVI